MKLEDVIKEYEQRIRCMPMVAFPKERYIKEIIDHINREEKKFKTDLVSIIRTVQRESTIDSAINIGKVFCLYENKSVLAVFKKKVENCIATKAYSFDQLYKTFSEKDVFCAISNYSYHNHFDVIMEYFFRYGEFFGLQFAKDLRTDRIKEVLHSHGVDNMLIHSAVIHSVSMGIHMADATIEVYNKYCAKKKNHIADLINRCSLKASNRTTPEIQYINIMRVLDKYIDLDIADTINESIVYEKALDCDELLRDDTYERIKRNPSDINKVANVIYTNIRKMLEELQDARWEVLDNVARAYRVVMGIHEERSGKHKESIAMNFYQELNRAIKQGTNEKEKEMNLKRYCSEVCEKMRESAEELMYET